MIMPNACSSLSRVCAVEALVEVPLFSCGIWFYNAPKIFLHEVAFHLGLPSVKALVLKFGYVPFAHDMRRVLPKTLWQCLLRYKKVHFVQCNVMYKVVIDFTYNFLVAFEV